MPTWAWIVIGVVAAGTVTAIVGAAFATWNRVVRRYLRILVGKREEARAMRRALDELVGGLRQASDEKRAVFADDPDAVERHSLADLATRARVLAEELNTMPLPRRLVPAAEALADAADILAEEAERAGEGTIRDESLHAISATDLERVGHAFTHADATMMSLEEEYGVDEHDVYGKGLYI